MSVFSDVPSYNQQSPFGANTPTLFGSDLSAAKQAGWTNSWGDIWTNSNKPGQYLSGNSLKSLLAKQGTAATSMNPASFNTGADYQSAVNPYLAQSLAALSSGSSSVSDANQYETRLNALLDNPNSIADTGAYKFAFDQGQQAVERSAAAKGMTGSGNVLAELTKYGQGMASQQYNTEADRLAGLSGSQKNYILGLKSAANSEAVNKSANLLNMGNLALSASKAKSDDYWNAQNMASTNALRSGYYNQNIW